MITQNKRIIGILGGIAALLMIPWIAMEFTDEVKWSSFDFLIMGILLLATGLGSEFVLRKARTPITRFVLITVIIVVFLLTWAELAVGIFGTPFAGS